MKKLNENMVEAFAFAMKNAKGVVTPSIRKRVEGRDFELKTAAVMAARKAKATALL